MKILITGTRGIPNILGGVETHCEHLFPLIAENSNYNITLVRRSSYIQDSNKIQQYKGITLVDIFSPRQKSVEAIVHTFLAIIYARLKGAHIIHIHAIGPAILTPFARLLRLKVVFTHHGADYNRQKWGKIAKWILKTGEKWGVKYANHCIVISQTIYNDIQKFNPKRVSLIPNGVTIPEKTLQTHYIESLGLQPQKYMIVVGRFVPEKGFHDMLQAYISLQTDYKLVFVGDADHESEYSKHIKIDAKKHGVVLTGFIKGEKLHQIFSHAGIFVMPSYHEGLPIALLEAMSYNLPVVVSNISANTEIELPKSSFFEVGNIHDLSEKISQTLSDKQQIDYSHILTRKYNWHNIARETIQVYSQL
jgi:glycosyltransferase involved in cell wall biosynthesis